nr:group II intron reverse transcriptase/maturase [Cryptomonas borealis]
MKKNNAEHLFCYRIFSPLGETTSFFNLYNFQFCKNSWDAHTQIYRIFSGKNSPKWILSLGIRECLNIVIQPWFLLNIFKENRLLECWCNSRFFAASILCFTYALFIQSGPLFPILSSNVLRNKHLFLLRKFPRKIQKDKKIRRIFHINIICYEGTFIITGVKPLQLERIKKRILDIFLSRDLKVHIGDIKVSHISGGFDFLGWTFKRSSNGSLISKISKSAIEFHCRFLRTTIKHKSGVSPEGLIRILNPIIINWCNYHRCCINNYSIWYTIDRYLFRLLFKWCRNRHPRKPKTWIYAKYWKFINNRKTFTASKCINSILYTLFHYSFRTIKT